MPEPAREVAPSALEHELLRELAIERFGLELPRARRAALAHRLRRRLDARGVTSFGEYYDLLRRAPGADEWGLFADAVTNAETYFFRVRGQFEELIALLDELGARPLRVLSAGCSSGEEAYSLAAVLAAHARHGFEVVGTDISTPRLAEACRGRYGERSFRDEGAVPGGGTIDDHFEQDGDAWTPRASLRARVTFQPGNLADPNGLRLGRFDVIFCRNVLIYAHAGGWPRFLRSLAGALAPGGTLFLGDSESLLGVRTPFRARRLRHHFAYVHAA
jgi:chemotaxis methyl-accepting protein methylase